MGFFSNINNIGSVINQNALNMEINDKNRKIITLGTWEDEPVKWLVLKEDTNSYFCVSEDVLFDHCFNESSAKGSDYSTSDIRKFLNNDFYNECFNESEKYLIINHKITGEFSKDVKDYVFLLSKSEIEQLMTDTERVISNFWYTRTSGDSTNVCVNDDYFVCFGYYRATNSCGIRPAILIRK